MDHGLALMRCVRARRALILQMISALECTSLARGWAIGLCIWEMQKQKLRFLGALIRYAVRPN